MKSKKKKKTKKRNKKRHERQKVVTGTPVQPASDLFDQHIARQTARIALECKNNELACRRKKCFPNERFDEMTFANSIDTDSTAYASAKKYKEQILHPKPQLNRVMSRLWEMCLPINADGADKRRVKVYSRQDEFPEMYPPTQPSNPT